MARQTWKKFIRGDFREFTSFPSPGTRTQVSPAFSRTVRFTGPNTFFGYAGSTMPAEPRRPLAVTILAIVYIAIGAGGFISHFHGLREGSLLRFDGAIIELVELIALTAGIFLLFGRNWARWLALAWIGFHVVISAFDSFGKVAIHAVFFAAIGWILFRSGAARYFRRERAA